MPLNTLWGARKSKQVNLLLAAISPVAAALSKALAPLTLAIKGQDEDLTESSCFPAGHRYVLLQYPSPKPNKSESQEVQTPGGSPAD